MSGTRRWLAGAAAAALVMAGLAVSGVAGAQEPPPPGALPGNGSPPGANDWDCVPSDAHPEPVVLVHGTFANMSNNWQFMSPLLADAGYCVFALNYGVNPAAPPLTDQVGGLTRMEDSAEELASFVDRVLDETGARQVDILGHSQGSLMPNYYVRFLGGAKKVDDYVGLTPLWDGTKVGGYFVAQSLAREFGLTPAEEAVVGPLCASCLQFHVGSDFIEMMNSDGGPAHPDLTYTMILTKYDELVIPYTSGLLDAENATNFVLQDVCATDPSEHGGVAYDPVAGQLVLNALDRDAAAPVPCLAPAR